MSRLCRVPLSAAAVFLALGLLPAATAEPVRVHVDQATLMKLPERVGTIIIGNPLIADVTLQPGGLLVVTGKGYGATNLVALDRDGNVLTERDILVSGPRDRVLVVQRGADRQTYSCEPFCEPRITLGDGQEVFSGALGQATTRSAGAAAAQGNGAR